MPDNNNNVANRLKFPHCIVLKASAGSGKTHALTLRYATFVLSSIESGQKNDLTNILAITFSNNAAKEMKERILKWLKAACLDEQESLKQLSSELSIRPEEIKKRASILLEHILENYSDFHVCTIDSFMTTIFKASAMDFGFNPDFEIVMDSSQLLVYSFNLFLRCIRKGTSEAELLGSIISYISEHKDGNEAYLWDPSATILDQIKDIYQKLSAMRIQPLIEDHSAEMAIIKNSITAELNAIDDIVRRTGLRLNGNSSFKKSNLIELAAEGRHSELIGKEFKTPPVPVLKKSEEAFKKDHKEILDHWESFKRLVSKYACFYARSFYIPYLRVYDRFRQTLDMVKRRQERVFIGDICRTLVEYVKKDIVPDIYFKLGETIFHYLIDEFQDTSPVQWEDLLPLIENSLSQDGSLFVVGDTKQAIYGFRNADYTIMKNLESGAYFGSVSPQIENLRTNFRSSSRILDFNAQVFLKNLKQNEKYGRYGELSGLTGYEQNVKDMSEDPGHAEVIILNKNDEEPSEREEIQRLIEDLHSRRFSYSEIAVLTQKNEDAVRVSGWLNEKNIPFISLSNLDIRRQKLTVEVISLLNFLDSPVNDHAFACFILGDIFLQTAEHRVPSCLELFRRLISNSSGSGRLYKAFQSEFPDLWNDYFSELFSVAGYFPLYDLVSEAFRIFRLWEIRGDEQATLVKILEVIKDFEGSGFNSLRDFLDFAEDDNADTSAWNMDVPKNIDAVQVMTVHKAKGLGFPAVILLLYRPKPFICKFCEEETGKDTRLLKISNDICKSAPELQPLYDNALEKDWVAKLNSLYVGLTRAEEEMYVIGVRADNDTFPFDILPADCFPKTGTARTHVPKRESRPECRQIHCINRIPDMRRTADLLVVPERRRGEFLHRVLSNIVYIGNTPEDDVKNAVTKALRDTGEDFDMEEISILISNMLELQDIRPLFIDIPGRRVLVEQEIVGTEGSLFRMDRLVIDQECVTIIEYKTGTYSGATDSHMAQVKNYMKLISYILNDRPVTGMIVYIDLGKVVIVR